MSEVSKVNAVAIADIETINGADADDIESLNSVDFVTGFSNKYSIQIGNNGGTPDYSYLRANGIYYNFVAGASGDTERTAPYGDMPFSISIWFQQDTFVANPFISKAAPGSNRDWQMNFHNGKYVWWKLNDPSGYYIQVYDTDHDWSGLSSGWHHLVLKYGAPSGSAANTLGGEANRAGGIARRNSMYYYMDGVRYSTGHGEYPSCYNASTATYVPCYTGLRTSPADPANTVNIGGFNPGGNQTFRGRMDEVSIWTKALTDADVTAIYNSGTPGELSLSSSLKSWWRMGDNNGGTGTTVTDVQGVANADAYEGTSAGWSATSGFDTDVPP